MGFFDEKKNVDAYIKIAEGYDGRELVACLSKYLTAGSTVLELGMGPGVDLDLLAEHFTVTGSDLSEIFLDMYRQKNPEADLLLLDAVSLDTDRTFDCIYSNKVLHHLSKSELQESFAGQTELIPKGGYLMHSFWHGEGEEEHEGLRFVYYKVPELLEIIGTAAYDVVDSSLYKEFKKNDSFYILIQKK